MLVKWVKRLYHYINLFEPSSILEPVMNPRQHANTKGKTRAPAKGARKTDKGRSAARYAAPLVEKRFIQPERSQMEDAFVARSIEALTALKSKLSDGDLRRAVQAETPLETAYRGLMLADRLEVSIDPLQRARIRGFAAKRDLERKTGGFLTTKDLNALLGISGAAITKRCANHKLLVIREANRGNLFPRIQFDDQGEVLEGLPDVLEKLAEGGTEDWGQLQFLLRESSWLDQRRPIDVLRDGKTEAVIGAAERFGEQEAV